MSLSRRLSALNDHDDDVLEEDDVLGTPGARKKGDVGPETPMPVRSAKRSGRASKGAPLTLRDQEKHIDSLKKENFNVKLRVHFLEERLAQLAPDQMDQALKQNINLKIEVQNRGLEIKKLKKLVLELERELERLQKGHGSSRSRERELEEKLDERDREIKDLRRKLREGRSDGDAMRELENRNDELEAELGDMRSLLEDNVEEINRLRVLLEGGGNVDAHRRLEELEGVNEDLRAQLDEHADVVAQREDEREDLLDEIERLRLQIEDLQRRREAESYERSQSRAQVFEEREEREAVEDNLSAMKDNSRPS
ncbi:microtubule associated-domain-containing protein [Schizophyllum amplum]|uniref:Microtubule associated-domain-containing protein n=1 Tax=Schizophyllum amplum TaxID=97359 RepID=A0A550BWU6_9AGAR|nr:microtubule associated-domain-containing protein [Auriculariopsis ampla]